MLKKELEEMGMFAPEYKQPIPAYAKTIGVVTASDRCSNPGYYEYYQPEGIPMCS